MIIIFSGKEEMDARYVEVQGEPHLALADEDVVLLKYGHTTEIVYGPFTGGDDDTV